jgi:hypothetical protein
LPQPLLQITEDYYSTIYYNLSIPPNSLKIASKIASINENAGSASRNGD